MARTRKTGREAGPPRRDAHGQTASPSITGEGALDALRRRAESWGLILHARPAKSEGTAKRKGSGEKREGGR
ncbi:MAG TPA: hypothetical protein VEY09_14815 [Pyrinomonadaceae bacterium]|nr:hypothetical protein [Pyrinomonadaceae bacterium]